MADDNHSAVVIGWRNVSTGVYSSVNIGHSNCQTGNGGLTIGTYNCQYPAGTGIAVGSGNLSNNGNGNIFLGSSNCASGGENISIGYSSCASAYRAITMGSPACALGQDSIAMGACTNSRGTGSVVLGACSSVTASGTPNPGNTAVGHCNIICGTDTGGGLAVGFGNTVCSRDEGDQRWGMAIGQYNQILGTLARNYGIGQQNCVFGSGSWNWLYGIGLRHCGDLNVDIGFVNNAGMTSTCESVTIGRQNCACNTTCNTTVLGSFNVANADKVTAIGCESTVSAARSIVIGNASLASGTCSAVIGDSSCSTVNKGIVIGHTSCVTSACGTALGSSNIVSHTGAVVIGTGRSSVVADTVHLSNLFLYAATGPFLDDAAFYTAGGTAGQAYISSLSGSNMLTIAGFN